MSTTIEGWTTLTDEPAVLVRDYSFGGGRANGMAVRLPDQSWMIVSPPPDITTAEALAFTSYGPVVALLENNGTHHIGLGPWRARFPAAVTYATPNAAARIRKKGKDYGELEPTTALSPLLGDKVAVLPIEGSKVGDVVVRVQADNGTLLYASDFIANFSRLPKNLFARALFKLSDSAPGLKVFTLFFKLYVGNRKAASARLIQELESHPPTVLVPAHGDVTTQPNLGPTLVAMLRGR